MHKSKLNRITKVLLKNRNEIEGFWPWLSDLNGRYANKKRANKFLLGCILDYQIPADTAWENARRLAEDILGDPNGLWNWISNFSKKRWMSRIKVYRLHRFPKAHERVWRIAKEIVTRYDGDARKIWKKQTPYTLFKRLNELRVGKQIANMVVGALIDTGQIKGVGDVKADVHVKRVLGRVLKGDSLSQDEAIEMARKMYSKNPWLLDQPLYLIGVKFCFATNPNCGSCYLKSECTFYKRSKR
jgi:endonuclease III